jgi:hypothetical protein
MADDERDSGLRIAPYVDWTSTDAGLPAVTPSPRDADSPAGDGPAVFAEDSWDHAPGIGSSDERYRGVRRVNRRRRRVGLVLAGVGIVVVVAVGLILAVTGGSDRGADALWVDGDTGTSDAASADATVPTPSPALSVPVSNAGPDNAIVLASYEAEGRPPDVKLRGSARVVAVAGASDGEVVTGVGNWGGQDPGSIQFRGVTVPAGGTYKITLAYVPDAATAGHTALVEVAGAAPLTVTFSGGSGCCAVASVDVVLAAGTHSITVSNVDSAVPPLDTFTVTRGS